MIYQVLDYMRIRVSYVPLLVRFVFPWGAFHSRVTGTCPVTTDLIMRVYVRTNNNGSAPKQATNTL